MCLDCWDERNQPKIDTPAIRAAVAAVAEVYEHNGAGGNLHVIVDDWNIEDQFFEPDEIVDYGDSSPEKLAAERRCFDVLKALSEDERATALAIYDGYWNPGDLPRTIQMMMLEDWKQWADRKRS